MPRKFCKMQGAGNDYIYFDCRREEFPNPSFYAKMLSDRRFGIGGDGIVLLLPDEEADIKMRMFNADGSEGKMCGNAVRCIGRFLFDESGKTCYTVNTGSGVKTVTAEKDGTFTVNMGQYDLSPRAIPSLLEGEAIDYPFQNHLITCLSMGNPHCVLFEDPSFADLPKLAREVEESGLFPEGVNLEVASILGGAVFMRVFERGSGETLSCGTGACAVGVAAYLTGRTREKQLLIRCKGGWLKTKMTDDGVLLNGPAVAVYTGEITL
ncbi:MAG: diaminopimelate epimerase [Clostridia bacterium]|nr:diaminopimelate epimerase [Clostridia bacterium]